MTKRIIFRLVLWKYKYFLEYNPRNFGSWIIILRRELKRHL